MVSRPCFVYRETQKRFDRRGVLHYPQPRAGRGLSLNPPFGQGGWGDFPLVRMAKLLSRRAGEGDGNGIWGTLPVLRQKGLGPLSLPKGQY